MESQNFMIKIPTLPVELVDNISDHVASEGGQKSLSALALTSSALLRHVRSRRFRKICFQHLMHACFAHDAARCFFVAELLTKSPSIYQHVHKFSIRIMNESPGSFACLHPNLSDSHWCDKYMLKRSFDQMINGLSLILPDIPFNIMLTFHGEASESRGAGFHPGFSPRYSGSVSQNLWPF
jgi:hypothetical protein